MVLAVYWHHRGCRVIAHESLPREASFPVIELLYVWYPSEKSILKSLFSRPQRVFVKSGTNSASAYQHRLILFDALLTA